MPNHLKFRQIKAFTLALENGSFKAAAQILCITQPSFTALIKALEEDLGFKLFERTARQCLVTEQGRDFYQRVCRPLEDLEEAYSLTKEEGLGSRGRLKLATVAGNRTVTCLGFGEQCARRLSPALPKYPDLLE